GRRSLGAALRRVAPLLAVALVWAGFHPLLGGRWLHPAAPLDTYRPPLAGTVAATVLSLFNLDAAPAPAAGWARIAPRLIAGAAVLLALAFLPRWAGRWLAGGPGETPRDPSRTGARALVFGAGWAVLG